MGMSERYSREMVAAEEKSLDSVRVSRRVWAREWSCGVERGIRVAQVRLSRQRWARR